MDPDTVASASPHATHIRGEGSAHVNVNRIDISERTLSVIALALAAAAIVTAFWGIHEAGIAEREARMYEYYTLEMDAKLIAAGVKKPDEAIAKRKE